MSAPAHLTIERLGQRGEGVAKRDGVAVFVPYALPGETVLAEVDRGHGRCPSLIAAL